MELPYLVPRIEAALSTKSRKNGEGREKRKKKKGGEEEKGKRVSEAVAKRFVTVFHCSPGELGWTKGVNG